MAYGMDDRVREQVSAFAGGTGAVTLPNVAVSGFQTFLGGWGASGTGEYCLVIGAQWETGFGTLNAGGTQLTRTTVYDGTSGAGVAVNFSAGVMDCFGALPAELAHFLNMLEISVASATTCDIGAVRGSCIEISGTTTITGLGTSKNRRRYVRFSGALLLTYNATSLILPGAANITTAAGDTAVFQSDSSGNWRCISYRAAATSPPGTTGTFTHKGPVDLSAAAAGQIIFPASANLSANANTLDDYEEGTFTPALKFGGATTGITYGTQIGRYQKIGRVVSWTIAIILTSKGSATGAATITGLPFTVLNLTNLLGPSTWYRVNWATTPTLTPITAYNTTTVFVRSAGGTDMADTDFNNTSELYFQGSYETAS